jgi:hypothetical protein
MSYIDDEELKLDPGEEEEDLEGILPEEDLDILPEDTLDDDLLDDDLLGEDEILDSEFKNQEDTSL